MPPDKTDPFGPHHRTVAGIAAVLLLLVGPGAGVGVASYVAPDDHTAEIAALHAKVDALLLHDVQLANDVARLADTISEVRKIEEAAHPRAGVPRQDSP